MRLHMRGRSNPFPHCGEDEYGFQTQAGCSGAVFPIIRMTEIEGEPKGQKGIILKGRVGYSPSHLRTSPYGLPIALFSEELTPEGYDDGISFSSAGGKVL
jgi:hypothetical protein